METYNKMLENMDPGHQAKPRRWPFCGIWSTSSHVRWGVRLVPQALVAIYMGTSVGLSIKLTEIECGIDRSVGWIVNPD